MQFFTHQYNVSYLFENGSFDDVALLQIYSINNQ